MFQSPIGTNKTEETVSRILDLPNEFQSPIGTNKTQSLSFSTQLTKWSFNPLQVQTKPGKREVYARTHFVVSIPYRYKQNLNLSLLPKKMVTGFNPLQVQTKPSYEDDLMTLVCGVSIPYMYKQNGPITPRLLIFNISFNPLQVQTKPSIGINKAKQLQLRFNPLQVQTKPLYYWYELCDSCVFQSPIGTNKT